MKRKTKRVSGKDGLVILEKDHSSWDSTSLHETTKKCTDLRKKWQEEFMREFKRRRQRFSSWIDAQNGDSLSGKALEKWNAKYFGYVKSLVPPYQILANLDLPTMRMVMNEVWDELYRKLIEEEY